MKKIYLLFVLISFVGCSSIRVPDYIQSKHPYVRKISGKYDDIVVTIKDVLYKEGWLIQGEWNPSVYERRLDGADQSKDVLFVSEVKEKWKILWTTYTHLNVFVHANADGAEVEVRFEALNPGIIKRSNTRNDKLANEILDKIEQDIEGK